MIATIAGGSGLGLFAQPYRPVVFLGHSMEPTYRNWSMAMTKPVTGPLHRGDVVVLNSPDGIIVKRIALLPGDYRWRIRVGSTRVDIDPSVISKKNLKLTTFDIVPPGKVFVLGDNRTRSVDSRYYGYFDLSDIQRVVISPRPYLDEFTQAGYTLPRIHGAGIFALAQR